MTPADRPPSKSLPSVVPGSVKQLGKRGIADPHAWEAAKRVAKALRKARKAEPGTDDWRKLPWREIRDQLRLRGREVDLDAIPPSWTGESMPYRDLVTILEQAGFRRMARSYVWPGEDG